MTKNVIIIALLVLVIWFGAVIVRIENERYALSIGACGPTPATELPDCARFPTRTHWWWHLYYALTSTD